MPGTIDLNCDIGEFAPGDPSDVDELLFPLISSANIACGFHAGDQGSMKRSVDLAQRFDVGIGAHVSFLDREGFGRRVLPFTAQQLASQTVEQIEALLAAMSGSGASLTHVKPHGALYSVLAADFAAANSVAAVVRGFDAGLALFGPAGSAMQEAASANQLSFVAEGFPERGYRAAAELQPRGEEGAIVEDPTEVGRRAVAMALGRPVPTVGGDRIVVPADTVCVHSDHPTAVQNAKAIRAALAGAGVVVRAAR